VLYLIYTTDQNKQIGDDKLFAKTCSEDKKWFQSVTKHHKTCLVGKNTAQTLPELKNRKVVTTKRNQEYQNGIIIGGKVIYEAFWDKVDVIYRSIHKKADFGGLKFEPNFENLVLFEKTETEELIKEIWIKQPYKDLEITIENHPNFELIQAKITEEKAKFNLNLPMTGSLLVKSENQIIVTQDLSKHKLENLGDSICVREKLRKQDLVKTGQYYDLEGKIICEGCFGTNHSEYLAVAEAQEKNLGFQNGICYLYGHYWSCQSCQQALKSIGIKKIILDKAFVGKFLNIYLD
jgi:dihydrofolate reductase/deoxycytidylate deaminase